MEQNIYAKNALTCEWTEMELDTLRENYCNMKVSRLAELICRSENAVRIKADQLGLRKTYSWTNEEVKLLKEKYSLATTQELQFMFPHPLGSIAKKAEQLGLVRQNLERPTWRKDELSMLREMATQGLSDEEIANKLNRPIGSVIERRLELSIKLRETWSEAETELLKKHYSNTDTDDLLIMFPGRSAVAIRSHASGLGLYKPDSWTSEEDKLLILKYSTSIITELFVLLPNKTKNQIKRHAWKFGLKKDLATLARCFGTSLDKIPEYPGRLSQWRRDILKRDEFRCQECGIVKNRLFLQAHHIIPRRDPDCDKYELNNGICLCNDCHDAIKNREYEVKDKYFNIVLSKEQNHDI